MVPDKKDEESPINNVMLPTPITVQKPYKRENFIGHNNSSCADSLFEPQTFGYPSFFEDQFAVRDHLGFIDNPTNCCNFDQFFGTFTSSLPCAHEYIVPQENLFC